MTTRENTEGRPLSRRTRRTIFLEVLLGLILSGISLLAQDDMPGQLSAAHEALAVDNGCSTCHTKSGEADRRKCLTCHRPIQESLDASRGYHGRWKDKACWECHKEHQGKEAGFIDLDVGIFDHSQTGYILSGAHADLTCDQCHRGTGYMGTAIGCGDCHESPHDIDRSIPCAQCHGSSPKRVAGDFHGRKDMFAFHSQVPCVQCHRQKTFSKTNSVCVSCHIDYHKGSLGLDCGRCHRWAVWKVARMDHGETGFPLMGAHLGLECGDCHRDLQTLKIIPRPSGCVDCHERQFRSASFPHTAYGIGLDCQECHLEDTWKYAHSPFWFNVQTGAHAGVECKTCHKEPSYFQYTCRDCHQGHPNDNNGRCLDCHPGGFNPGDGDD